jgi:ubiquinol-cytochrome c reductase cytochrome c subunit
VGDDAAAVHPVCRCDAPGVVDLATVGWEMVRRAVPAPLLGWALVAGAAALLWSLAGPDGSAQAQEAQTVARGAELYAVNCASCHGPRGQGGPPDGVRAGPPLAGVEVAYVDQQMRTGRMPIADRSAGVVRDDEPLEASDREAILAWMTDELDLVGEVPQVGEGDRSRGQELYTVHCAACHGSVGNGGVSGSGVLVLGLRGLDPIAIVEATRVGPYDMPAFEEALISQEEADDIAAFVSRDLADPEVTLLGLPELNRVALSGLAGLLILVVVGGIILVSRDVPLPTAEEQESAP